MKNIQVTLTIYVVNQIYTYRFNIDIHMYKTIKLLLLKELTQYILRGAIVNNITF